MCGANSYITVAVHKFRVFCCLVAPDVGYNFLISFFYHQYTQYTKPHLFIFICFFLLFFITTSKYIYIYISKAPHPLLSHTSLRCQRAGGTPRLGTTKDERTRGVVRQVRSRQRSAPQSDGGSRNLLKWLKYVEIGEIFWRVWSKIQKDVFFVFFCVFFVKVGEVVERE